MPEIVRFYGCVSAGGVFSVCVFFVCQRCFYIQCPCMSLDPSSPPSSPFSLAVGDGGAAAQLDDHLLAVVEGPLVSQLFQGASRVRQHAHPLTGSRQEGGRKVAARQHHGLRLLPLAWPRLALLCTQKKKRKEKKTHENVSSVEFQGELLHVISHRQPIRRVAPCSITDRNAVD